MKYKTTKFYNFIKSQCAEQGISLSELARYCDVSFQNMYARLNEGLKNIKFSLMVNIADKLGLPLVEIEEKYKSAIDNMWESTDE